MLRCPDCAEREAPRQAKALGDALEALPGTLVFITATLRHWSNTRVVDQLQHIAAMWSHLTRGRAYSALKKKYGLSGSYKTLECTWSEERGFNVHTHSIMILNSDADVEQFRRDWFALWCDTAKKLGHRASKKPQDVQAFDRSDARVVAQYVTKVRFPVDALEKAAQGDLAGARAWTEWCSAVSDLRTRSTQPSGVLKDWNKRPPAPEVLEEVQVTPEVAMVIQERAPELIDAVAETLRLHGAVVAVEHLRLHGYQAKAIVHRRSMRSRLRDLLSRRRPRS
ncbi:hypothetical protein C5C10_03230 [Rathayibacter sp. AY1A3]|nr:hypothetical protein C5C10_03230 [Rathayibacter sp. AY1A3]